MQPIQRVRKTDLARNTRRVINDVLRGQTAVVESHGQPEVAIMDIIDYRITRAAMRYYSHQPEVDVEPGLSDEQVGTVLELQERYDLALAHFLAGAISLGRVAEVLGLPWLDLRTRFLRLDVPLRTAPTDPSETVADSELASNGAPGLGKLNGEEQLVAELDLLGIHYLSRQTSYRATSVRAPAALLADLVQQPSARVRAAVIALLLSHPEYAEAVPAALERLGPEDRVLLQSFYMAAVLLQREHADRLRTFLASRWKWLPALPQAAAEFDLPIGGSPRESLAALGRQHRQKGRRTVNWVGTYEQVVGQLLRQWEAEARWSQ